ncbi:MAG: NAD(P)H-hydrate dehydratase, partial [Synechococcus sp. ELA057]
QGGRRPGGFLPIMKPSQPSPVHPLSPPCRSGWPAADADHLLVTAADMAQLEEQLFASGLPVAALMEKAALAMAQRLLAGLDRSRGVLVLAGPGHNGGDGLVIARELHLAGVAVRLWSPFERHRPLTQEHLRHVRWLGVPCLEAPPDPGDPCMWVDALFGIGQNRPPSDLLVQLLEERQRRRPGALVAVDGPTGLCADSGRLLGSGGATASLTWSIGLIKRGFVQDQALRRVGRLDRIDLALPAVLTDSLSASTPLGLRGKDLAFAPLPELDPAAAKYGRGRLLLLAGSRRFRGAASLALAGASASGCGSLRAAVPLELADQLWMQHPHVVIDAVLGCGTSEELDLAALPMAALERLDAVLVGPGLGLPDPAAAGSSEGHTEGDAPIWQGLQRFSGLLLLDADGLNWLALRTNATEWLQGRRGATWITPHQGEFHRLFPDLENKEPLEAAILASQRSGAVILLKGARSIVAAPDGRTWQILEAAPEAARAGLGDVLAGFAAGLGAMTAAAGADKPEPTTCDAGVLATAALQHAQAGLAALKSHGAGGVTPMAVASALAAWPASHKQESKG